MHNGSLSNDGAAQCKDKADEAMGFGNVVGK
jgi:hypothetical protein